LNILTRTGAVSNFVVKLQTEDLPLEVIEASIKCLLAWKGVTLNGAEDPLVRMVINLNEELGGREQASIIG
jgi:2-methylcitrate dehydratase PrpD